MKKALTILLTLTLLLGLAACGTGGSSQQAESAPGTASAPGASDGGDWAYIEDKGTLVIGITYFEPMNYLTDSGDLTGFETEFATAVCEILGVEPVFQEINWSAKETELAARSIDCIWNGMTITEERMENMNISQPYMQNMQVLIVNAENAEAAAAGVEGLTIVAEAGSAGETIVESENFFEGASFIPVDTQAKALIEVAAGTADGCVIDYVTSIGMIGEGTDFAGLVTVEGRGFDEEEYGIAVRKGDDELLGRINDAINELIANGTLAAIAEKYKLEDLLIIP